METKMRSSEASLWLREILIDLRVPVDGDQVFGTHSAKATTLSWAAKAGLANADRKMLGHHATGAEETMLTYSRDAMAGPVRRLGALLDVIRSRAFRPDVTRSGRWDHGGPEMLGEAAASRESEWYNLANYAAPPGDNLRTPGEDADAEHRPGPGVSADTDPVGPDMWISAPPTHPSCQVGGGAHDEEGGEEEQADFSDDTEIDVDLAERLSASSGSDLAESDQSEVEDRAAEALARSSRRARPAGELAGPFFQHRVLKTVHLGGVDDRLACGRVAEADRFIELRVEPAFAWPRCKVCWGSLVPEVPLPSGQ